MDSNSTEKKYNYQEMLEVRTRSKEGLLLSEMQNSLLYEPDEEDMVEIAKDRNVSEVPSLLDDEAAKSIPKVASRPEVEIKESSHDLISISDDPPSLAIDEPVSLDNNDEPASLAIDELVSQENDEPASLSIDESVSQEHDEPASLAIDEPISQDNDDPPSLATEDIVEDAKKESISADYPPVKEEDSTDVLNSLMEALKKEGSGIPSTFAVDEEEMESKKAEDSKSEKEEDKSQDIKDDDDEKEIFGQTLQDDSSLPIGERLVRRGLISHDQLEVALREQREQRTGAKKMLGAILVEMGFITESSLGSVLTETTGVKQFDLKSSVLDSNIINKIPKEIAKRHMIVAVAIEKASKTVMLATADIYNILAIDQAQKFFPADYKVVPVYSSESQIEEIIEQYYEYDMSIQGILKEIEHGAAENVEISGEKDGYINPTVRLVDAILIDAIKSGASDIHFEPESFFLRIRYRIDGRLIQVRSFHKEYWSAVIVRIKILSEMNIAETRVPQDGRITYHVLGREIDFRVASQPTVHGENVVMRILDKQKALVPLEKLGYSKNNSDILKRILKRPEGIIIVTGPTGSGKTTTLYSVLNYINDIGVNIMTLEDPVEYQLPLIRQTQIREGSALNFKTGLKSLMRQDPDIIFLGEIRDEDTANMAIRAAMTGHKVFSTLHTNDAIGAIPRLVDIGIPHHLLSGSLIGIIAQRLLRKLCDNCKIAYTPSDEECKILKIKLQDRDSTQIYRHNRCNECSDSGYKGRTAVSEILPITKEIDSLIAEDATHNKIWDYAVEHTDFRPMIEDGVERVIKGLTDIEELARVVDVTGRL